MPCLVQELQTGLILKLEPEIASANPPRHISLRPENQIYRGSRDIRNCRASKNVSCTGIAAGTRFYHTHNSNHLDQNIGLKKKKKT